MLIRASIKLVLVLCHGLMVASNSESF
uniref:Uncharacterized protein n=1 Tax=Arundo donax TaxID=35708 RepID=A0A0A9H4N4_ARUDO